VVDGVVVEGAEAGEVASFDPSWLLVWLGPVALGLVLAVVAAFCLYLQHRS
jgi:hypothetical protein